MTNKYAILLNPGHNRVYFRATKKLAISELTIGLKGCGKTSEDMETVEIGGVSYLTFSLEEELSERELLQIARLSFVYAFFIMVELEGEFAFKPVCLPDVFYMSDNISTIL